MQFPDELITRLAWANARADAAVYNIELQEEGEEADISVYKPGVIAVLNELGLTREERPASITWADSGAVAFEFTEARYVTNWRAEQ